MKRQAVLSVLVVLAVLAAACGTRIEGSASPRGTVVNPPGGGSGPKAPEGKGPSDAGVTDTEIRIGASLPLSGVVGFAGQEISGAIDSYFRTVNANGGINGRKLKLIVYDNRLEPAADTANIRKLYEEDKVVALFLTFADNLEGYIAEHKIPSLVFGVTPPGYSSKVPTIYPLVGNALLWTHQTVTAIKQLGILKPGMKVGIMYDTEFLDVRPYVPYIKAAWEKAGANVVTTDIFRLSDVDCSSLVLKVRELDIDWWDFHSLGWVLCASAAQRQGFKPKVGWGGWPSSIAGLASQVGPGVDGILSLGTADNPLTGAPRFKEPHPAHKEYVAAIKKYHPDLATELHLESPPQTAFWVAAKLFVAALEAQGRTVTKAGIVEFLTKVKNFDTGISPPILAMSPDCKLGSELSWFARWHWDAEKKTIFRAPETDYLTSPYKEEYGGRCFLTKISDEIRGKK